MCPRIGEAAFARVCLGDINGEGAVAECWIRTWRIKTQGEDHHRTVVRHEFRSSTNSRLAQKLHDKLERFAQGRLEEPYPYLILDAGYKKVRKDGGTEPNGVDRDRHNWVWISVTNDRLSSVGAR